MSTSRRRWIVGAAAAAALLVPAGLAWACVAVVSFTVNPSSVQPGGKVTVTGRDFAPGAPIEVHLDSPTGRLLATLPPHNNSVMQNSWNLDVPIPADVSNGEHVLVATQDYHNMNAGVPARATISVGTGAPPAATPAARPINASVDTGPSGASLALIALGVAAGALLLAGLITLAASRRSSPGQAEPVRS
jgi:hypothetical protein